jgi:RNA-binding protein
MLTSKQRAYLRGLANDIDTILQVGKDGVNDSFITQINDALEARELIKIRVLNNAPTDVEEVAAILEEACNAETVQKIGNKLVLYRVSKQHPSIILP